VWRALSVLFIVCALALAGMLAYNLIAAQQAARPAESSALPSGGVPEVFRPPDIPATQLIIPDLAIDTELTEAPRLGSSWDVSQFFEEIAHLEGTAYPGTSGNAVLAGHVHTTEGVGPFWNLRALQAGNMIIARGEGIEYRYQVEWVKVTDPDDDAVLAPADQPVLTLISCANWDRASWSYTERVVVRAALFDRAGVEEQPLPSPTPPVPSPFRG
jgi:LPXTG-site transpeptidase (sortase) family protein